MVKTSEEPQHAESRGATPLQGAPHNGGLASHLWSTRETVRGQSRCDHALLDVGRARRQFEVGEAPRQHAVRRRDALRDAGGGAMGLPGAHGPQALS